MKSRLISAVIYSSALLTGGAHAAVIYDNGVPPSPPVSFYFAEAKFAFTTAAENFTLNPGAATIGGVNWWGGCATLTNVCATTNLTLFFYDDAGGTPGSVIAQYNVGLANQTAVGAHTAGYVQYAYSANIPALALTAGVQYWLGIQNDSPTLEDLWGWESNLIGPHNDLVHQQFLNGFGWTEQDTDLAFNLTDAAVAVPEPLTISLFSAGLVGAAAMRRRKSKAPP